MTDRFTAPAAFVRLLGMIAALFALGLGAAAADTLTADQAQRFVHSMKAANAMAERMQNQDLMDGIEPQDMLVDGTFRPYTTALGILKTQHPTAVSELSGIAKANGFSGAGDWASTGDLVALAFMAIKTGDLPPMPAMQPSMIAMMPPEIQEQMKFAQAIMAAVKTVPAAHKEAVAPMVPELESMMGGAVPPAPGAR